MQVEIKRPSTEKEGADESIAIFQYQRGRGEGHGYNKKFSPMNWTWDCYSIRQFVAQPLRLVTKQAKSTMLHNDKTTLLSKLMAATVFIWFLRQKYL